MNLILLHWSGVCTGAFIKGVRDETNVQTDRKKT